jgi:hypothetical protein
LEKIRGISIHPAITLDTDYIVLESGESNE